MHWGNLLFSLLPITWAGYLVRQIRLTNRLRSEGILTTGRVVRQRVAYYRKAGFIPTVSYTTQAGEVLERESAGSSEDLYFTEGQEVVLCYDPAQPTCFLLDEELDGRKSYLLLVFASVFITLAWVGAVR